MSMPIVISVPHGGAYVPVKLRGRVLLSRQQLRADSDVDSPEIYAELVRIAATAELAVVARAIVDVNRAPTDFSVDGVIKTHTCWGEPIYKTPLTESEAANLIAAHHTPYHARLEHACRLSPLVGIDCHTMAALAPPIAPDTGPRPLVCIGTGDGACPLAWAERLVDACQRHLPGTIALNEPFSGGHITRTYGRLIPWVQLELSRTPAVSVDAKTKGITAAVIEWINALRRCRRAPRSRPPREAVTSHSSQP